MSDRLEFVLHVEVKMYVLTNMEFSAGVVDFCGVLTEMAASCRGICAYIQGMPMTNGQRYKSGQKRCTFCSLFLDTSEIRCPCCKTILRTKSRSSTSQQKQFQNTTNRN